MRQLGKLSTVLDQFASAASNFLLVLVIAREASVEEFGRFSIVYGGILVIVAVARGFLGEPLLLVAAAEGDASRGALRSAYLTTALPLLGVGLLALACSVPVREGAATAWILVGLLTTLAVTYQDAGRYLAFGLGRPAVALVSDLSWLGLQTAIFAGLQFRGEATARSYVAGWGLAALVAAVPGSLRLTYGFKAPGLCSWWRDTKGVSARLVAEYGIGSAATQAVVLGGSGVLGLTAAAALRGGELLTAPARLVATASIPLFTPRLVKLMKHEPAAAARLTAIGALAVGGVAVLWSAFVLIFTSGGGGELLLGESASTAIPVLPWFAAASIFSGASAVLVANLRAQRKTQLTLSLRLWLSVVLVVTSLVGAGFYGVHGLAAGTTMTAALGTIVWLQAVRSSRG